MGGDWREGRDEGKGGGGGRFFLCMISGQGVKRRGGRFCCRDGYYEVSYMQRQILGDAGR